MPNSSQPFLWTRESPCGPFLHKQAGRNPCFLLKGQWFSSLKTGEDTAGSSESFRCLNPTECGLALFGAWCWSKNRGDVQGIGCPPKGIGCHPENNGAIQGIRCRLGETIRDQYALYLGGPSPNANEWCTAIVTSRVFEPIAHKAFMGGSDRLPVRKGTRLSTWQ